MAPNTFKFETLDTFATIDKSVFLRKNTPLLSNVERSNRSSSFEIKEHLHNENDKQEDIDQSSLISESEFRERDDYWGWHNDETSTVRKTRQNKKLLEQILQEEEIRLFLSADESEKRLVDVSTKKLYGEQIESNDKQIDENYWTWMSDQDRTKEYFSVGSIEKRLIVENKSRAETKEDLIDSRNNLDDMWDWNNDETECEKRQKNNQSLLANILLEEEMRKEFLVRTIEQRLLEESKVSNENNEKMVTCENNSDVSYWDWQ